MILSLLLSIQGYSQRESITVKAGENPEKVLPFNYRYLNNVFEDGYLIFPLNKRTKVMKLNISLLSNLVVFIDEKNDTLTMTDDTAVSYVKIERDWYRHDIQKGYFKILSSDTVHVLASFVELSKRIQKTADEGYGRTSTASTTGNIGTVSRHSDVIVQRVTEYYLIDQRDKIRMANKSGFLAMFPTGEDQIKAYLKKEDIDFKKEEDIRKIFNYCLSL